MAHYGVFDHTADLGLEFYGKDARDLFRNAAIALYDNIVILSYVTKEENRTFIIQGSDWEDLLVNFLRELLYFFNGDGLLVRDVIITEIDNHHIIGTALGEYFNPDKHSLKEEIKAVTYHQVQVQHSSSGWTGRVICDV